MNRFSIITINLNNYDGLIKTFASVFSQSYPNLQYIVIDGGSTDESVQLIKENEHRINYWESKQDKGIYNAMNKGLAKANGDYILFLNSGDILVDENVLNKMKTELTGEQIIYTDFLITSPHRIYTRKFLEKPGYNFFVTDSLPHSGAVFTKRDGFTGELATYDENLKIASDWKWFMEAILIYRYSYKYIPMVSCIFDYTGISALNPDFLRNEKASEFEKLFPGLFAELTELNHIKNRFAALENSRYINFCLKLKKWFPFGKKALGL